jgi:hypothetical protein
VQPCSEQKGRLRASLAQTASVSLISKSQPVCLSGLIYSTQRHAASSPEQALSVALSHVARCATNQWCGRRAPTWARGEAAGAAVLGQAAPALRFFNGGVLRTMPIMVRVRVVAIAGTTSIHGIPGPWSGQD